MLTQINYDNYGDKMKIKKLITTVIITLVIVIIIFKFAISGSTTKQMFNQQPTYYFLQEGIYTSEQIMKENTKNINIKYVEKKDNKYYVYLGITKSESNATKLKKIYEEMGYQIYIKEQSLYNEEFESNLEQFDLLINSATTKDEILTITEVILANYEEIVKKQ